MRAGALRFKSPRRIRGARGRRFHTKKWNRSVGTPGNCKLSCSALRAFSASGRLGSGENIELFFVLADVELASDSGGDERRTVFAEFGNCHSYHPGGSVYPWHCLVEMARYFQLGL